MQHKLIPELQSGLWRTEDEEKWAAWARDDIDEEPEVSLVCFIDELQFRFILQSSLIEISI